MRTIGVQCLRIWGGLCPLFQDYKVPLVSLLFNVELDLNMLIESFHFTPPALSSQSLSPSRCVQCVVPLSDLEEPVVHLMVLSNWPWGQVWGLKSGTAGDTANFSCCLVLHFLCLSLSC